MNIRKRLTSLLGTAVLASALNANADSRIEIANLAPSQSPSVSGGIFYLDTNANATDGFDLSYDSYWTNRPPSPNNIELKSTTKIPGELSTDARSGYKPYNIYLSAVNKSNPSALINTTINRIKFTVKTDIDSSRLWLAKLHRDGVYNPGGESIDTIINLVTAFGGTNANLSFDLNLPGIVNLPSGTNNGYIDVSNVQKNQSFSAGNINPVNIELDKNQVSGLEYHVASAPTNGNVVVNGGVGTYQSNGNSGNDSFSVNLVWNNNGQSNYLGNIRYSGSVTNETIPAIPTLFPAKITGIEKAVGNGHFNINANVSPGFEHVLYEGTNSDFVNFPISTNTVAFSGDTNMVNTSYSVPSDKPSGFYKVGSR